MNYFLTISAEKELFPCAFFVSKGVFFRNLMFSRNETIFLLSL